MDILGAASACLLLFTPVNCHGTVPVNDAKTVQRLAQWEPIITEASRRFGIPADWIRSVIGAESGGRVTLDGKPITSPKGAMGLMQLMPETWQEMRKRYGLGDNPYDPHDNILAGTAYLRELFDRFGTGAFAAYNAGPGRFAAYMDGSKPLPSETRNYLRRIESSAPDAAISTPHEALFFVNSVAAKRPQHTSNADQSDNVAAINAGNLFVPLSSPSH